MSKQLYSILWEDDHLVLVNKPPGLLCIQGRFDVDEPNLKFLLKKKFGEIWTVHRIDRDTSGVVCYAKTEEAHALLSTMFSKQIPEKRYLAITTGQLSKNEGNIDLPIMENPQKRGRMITSAKGKQAFSSYKVLEPFKSHTLVEVSIKTGRTHQIRVHLQSLGHPVLADPFYNSKGDFFLSTIKGKKFNKTKHVEERPLLKRTALHAQRLAFEHPINNNFIEVEAPLHKDMRAVLNQMRKWDQL